jgi:thiamine pyrophosphate-dependent acetolactate synthase large subunit-like protein
MDDIDKPLPSPPSNQTWGSDVVADMLRDLGIPYIALNPGASYRGLHDSLVNHLGNRAPQMLLVLHEEHAVAIGHGWAKVTGKPLAAVLHSNVGLMHGTMAIFNAWCDRLPVIVLGATGPVDAARRRPWIDWIHTARDQGALVRPYTKWDDQPASAAAAQEALARAHQIACTAPRGPVYINLDAGLQEEALAAPPPRWPVERFAPPPSPVPARETIEAAAALLARAQHPVILMGRASRDPEAWKRRVALAEQLGARVGTDIKAAAAFPTDHPLHAIGPSTFLSAEHAKRLAEADVILSLDWVDLAGILRTAWPDGRPTAKVIRVSPDQYSHGGWSMDYQGLPPAEVYMLCESDVAVPLLLDAVRARKPNAPVMQPALPRPARPPAAALDAATEIDVPLLATALDAAIGAKDVSILHVPLSWAPHLWDFRHPLDYLGSDGGAGIGAGPGLAIGSALALRDAGSTRLPVALLGDGDYVMGVNALWTAAHYRIPLLIVLANNRSFFNDELHQERVARQRARPVENRWVGQAIRDPDLDHAALARAQGCDGIGPVEDPRALVAALREAAALVRAGSCCVVDVRVRPGYDPNTATAVTRGAS